MNKASILETLKKQVLHLKTQLNNLDTRRTVDSYVKTKSQSRSRNISPRFDSNNFDSSLVHDGGVKRFRHERTQSKNLSQLIKHKSVIERPPSLSPYRKAQINRTKENFDSRFDSSSSPRPYHVKNPLTGQGYTERKIGVKIVEQMPHYQLRQEGKKHYY